MRLIKTLAASAAAAVASVSAAVAGGFAPVVETPAITVVEPTGGGFSLPVWVIPAVVLVALIALASKKSNEE